MADPELVPLPSRIAWNPVTESWDGVQRWMFCPGTLDFMESQFDAGVAPTEEK